MTKREIEETEREIEAKVRKALIYKLRYYTTIPALEGDTGDREEDRGDRFIETRDWKA